jgi:HAD superfamily hydrolase (TIGR01484 family)
MRPLVTLDREDARRLRGLLFVRGLLFDLDDTFLSHGVLELAAYEALWKLKEAGLRLVAVTGRPSGWGEIIARQWPIDAAVTENGAIVVAREGRGVGIFDTCDEAERGSRRARLARLVDDVRTIVPDARLSDDVAARRSDVTWDIGEKVRLPEESVREIVAAIRTAGARTTQSSVHLHATFDEDDKASGVVRFLTSAFGEDPGCALVRYAFVGDSGNDAACFAAFRTTFGVANVEPYVSRLSVPPRFVATKSRGHGFAEIAEHLLRLRA